MIQMVEGFFTQEIWLLPNWAWFVIFIGVACLLIAAILVTCLLIKNKRAEAAPAEEKSEAAEEEKPESKEESKEEVKEEVKAEEKKPAKDSEKKAASTKSTAKTSDEKSTAKSTTAKKEEKSEVKEESAASEIKVYHISKRKEDGKWQVKAEGADRALRLFFTQADAIAYAKKVAGNQAGRIVIHKEGGGFRKINY